MNGKTFVFRAKAGMNSKAFPGVPSSKQGTVPSQDGAGGQESLHQLSIEGMLERQLAFAVVVKAEFIDHVVIDRPGVRDIPLLEALQVALPNPGTSAPATSKNEKG